MSGPIYFPNLRKDGESVKNATGTIVDVSGEDKACLDVFIQNPAGLAANVEVDSVIPGTGATNLGKAEDAVHASGDVGVMALAVRNDAGTAFAADGDYVPLSVDASGAVRVAATITEAATAADGAAAPAVLKVIAGVDGVGNTQQIAVDTSGELQIDVLSSALPTGAATAANQATEIASLASIDAGIPAALGQAAMAASMPVVIASDQSTLAVSAASLPLPTGAATAANQATEIASLASIDAGIPAALGSAASAASMPVVIASDQAAVATKAPVNAAGSIVNTSLTATTASSASAPANAVGFVLEAPSDNTHNVRWAIGGTASTTVGMLTEPGRDTGFIPCAATISVCAVTSGTNAFSIQWVLSS